MTLSTHPRAAAPASALPTYCTVAQLADLEPALTRGGIRADLFTRATNGLEASGAVIYRGRRLLIDRARYLAWLASRTRGAAA